MNWIPAVCYIRTIQINGFKSIQYMRESPDRPCTLVIGNNNEAKSAWTEALGFVLCKTNTPDDGSYKNVMVSLQMSVGEPSSYAFQRTIRGGEEKFFIDGIRCEKRKYRNELRKLSIFFEWSVQPVKNNDSDWYCLAKMPGQVLAKKLADLLRPKFGVRPRETSDEMFRTMVCRISALFTRAYQLLKGSRAVGAKIRPTNRNALWTSVMAVVKWGNEDAKKACDLDEKELAIASLALIYAINAYLCSSFIIVDEIHRIYDRSDADQKLEGLKKLATVRRGTQIIATCVPPPVRVSGINRIYIPTQ